MEENKSKIQYIREDLKQERSEYLDERKLLVGAEHMAAASFDKAMMTLAAASLGFSLTIATSVAHNPKGIGLLYTAWIMFSLALIFVTVALHQSQKAFRKACDQLEIEYLRRVKPLEREFQQFFGLAINDDEMIEKSTVDDNHFAETTRLLNAFSVAFFIVGTVCLVAFSINNFPKP